MHLILFYVEVIMCAVCVKINNSVDEGLHVDVQFHGDDSVKQH